MMKLFFAWMAGWLLAIAGLYWVNRRKIVINADDASEWQRIVSRDIRTLRPVNAEPIVIQRGKSVTVIDRGCA